MICGTHYQNAYVTEDLDAALAKIEATAPVRTTLRFDRIPVRFTTPQGEGDGVQSVGLVWIGDFNMEIIVPHEGDVLAIYREALPQRPQADLTFHHAAFAIDDWNEFEGRLAAQPFPVVLRGSTPGVLEFAYLDTRPLLGHYSEFVWTLPERWKAMGRR